MYIDEIDKIAKRGGGATSTRDVSGEGVQQALLKLVEGSEQKISKGGGRRREGGDEVMVDTRNILFIVGGAFPGLEELIGSRIQPKDTSIGFHSKKENKAVEVNELLENLLPDDLQNFGLIPEFIGRFPVTTFLQELDVEALLKILTEPKNSLVKQYRQLFAYQGKQIEFTQEALEFIAEDAVARKTGARGLRSVLESTLHTTMFEMPSIPGLVGCTVDVEEVDGVAQLVVKNTIDEFSNGQLDDSASEAAASL